MKVFTIKDIRNWRPCYDPSEHLPEEWSGTALDMLSHPTIPDKDKVWLLTRLEVMTDKGLRLFAVDCARRAQTYPKNYTPDPRTLVAIETAERFAEGLVTAEELRVAYYAADAARADAAYYAANDAAYCAAVAAADAAAYCAYYAAYCAADAAAYCAAAYCAELRKQIEFLVKVAEKSPELFVGENK